MISQKMTLENTSLCNDSDSNTISACSKFIETFDDVDDSSHDSKCEKEIGCDHIAPSPSCDFCPKNTSPINGISPGCFNFLEEHVSSYGVKVQNNDLLKHESNSENNSSHLPSTKIYLQPFIHQVGGHLCMLKFDQESLCKPLQEKEREFYENQIPDILKSFIPKYYGTVKVHLEEDCEGYVNLVTSSNDPSIAKPNGTTFHSTDHNHPMELDLLSSIQVKMKSTGSLEVLDPLMLNLFEKADPFNKTNESAPKCKSYSFNPWSLKRHKEQIVSMINDNESTYEFIRLEDLAAKFKYPCILDLKMGTRQYGDDAPEQKKITQRAKCQASTSASLGVRICGMQVYQPEKGAFFCYDKYIGRKLSISGFEQSLRTYLATAITNLKTHPPCPDIVGAILTKLSDLSSALSTLDSYRFYSSSLLVMYEGAPPATSFDQSKRSRSIEAPANGSGHIVTKRHCSRDRPEPPAVDALINVKMIDFAHSTGDPAAPPNTPTASGPPPNQTTTPSSHSGVDRGYMFGLDSLIRIVKGIHGEQLGDDAPDTPAQ